jgi:hypothetical protein
VELDVCAVVLEETLIVYPAGGKAGSITDVEAPGVVVVETESVKVDPVTAWPLYVVGVVSVAGGETCVTVNGPCRPYPEPMKTW